MKLAKREKEVKELKEELELVKKNGASSASNFEEMQNERD